MPKFDHAVKFNGKYYPAGADIPEKAAAVAAVGASAAKVDKDSATKPKAAQKANTARKKGDA